MEFDRRGSRGYAEDLYPELSGKIIGCAMKVHSALGPGLLESAYEACLCRELSKNGLRFRRQVPVPITYDGLRLDCGFRLDMEVEGKVVVEVKSVDQLLAVHDSQILTYLKVTGYSLGLLINFNVAHLRNGIRRRALTPR